MFKKYTQGSRVKGGFDAKIRHYKSISTYMLSIKKHFVRENPEFSGTKQLQLYHDDDSCCLGISIVSENMFSSFSLLERKFEHICSVTAFVRFIGEPEELINKPLKLIRNENSGENQPEWLLLPKVAVTQLVEEFTSEEKQ